MADLPPSNDQQFPARRSRWAWGRRLAILAGLLLIAYVVIAYVLLPLDWRHYFRQHPALDDVPGITQTKSGIPGDPINVSLVGTKTEVQSIMHAAEWFAADPLGLRSDLHIAEATVLDQSYAKAPVSSLYLFGRKEDLAFEQPVGPDPKQRHHVRFWQTEKVHSDGRPVWVGSATFDRRVGFSHTTGEITHHIAADVDAERDHVFNTLKPTGHLSRTYIQDGFHKQRKGRNGGGDPWHTDGDLYLGVIAAPAP
jgi:hypothetical protein